MHRRRTGGVATSNISIASGGVDERNVGELYHKTRKKPKRPSFLLFTQSQSIVVPYIALWLVVFIRSYLDGITAAGNETWYPVPLIGYVRSELALFSFCIGSIPFLLMILGWTYFGVLTLSSLAIAIPYLVMPGPIPMPTDSYHCFAIITICQGIVVAPFWKKPQAAIATFLAVAIFMPNLPEKIKPLYSSLPVEYIPQAVINYQPDIIEDEGAAALETGPLLQFVWDNRNDWVKVSHARALGYFVFGKNFNHDRNIEPEGQYSIRSGFRLTSYRETWGESDYRLHYPEKRESVSKMFRERFGSGLANIYARVLDVDPDTIVLGDTGSLANKENMGFPAVKIVFPSLFWHWFNNPHTDKYLYQFDEIDGNICDLNRQRTLLIPLTEPKDAGLYYWFADGTRISVDYKVGNVYSFEVSILHAIRPFPYFEWSRGRMMDSRITIQAFGIPCGNFWYITH